MRINISDGVVPAIVLGCINLIIRSSLVCILYNTFLVNITKAPLSYSQVMVIVLILTLIKWRPIAL